MYYIEIEDLVANALIEVFEKFQKRTVSFETLRNYGDIVVQLLKKENKDVILRLSRTSTADFFYDYTNLFDATETDITLKEGVSVDDLKEKFRSNMSFDVFLAFVNDEAVNVLKAVA